MGAGSVEQQFVPFLGMECPGEFYRRRSEAGRVGTRFFDHTLLGKSLCEIVLLVSNQPSAYSWISNTTLDNFRVTPNLFGHCAGLRTPTL